MYFFTDRFFFFEISHCIFINSVSFAHPVFVPIVSKKKLFKKEAVSLTVPFAARWFLLFGLFAFLGWCCETAYCSFFSRRFSNNALLHVPFSPLYGAGGLCAAALGLAVKKTAALFFACMAVCTALEYIVGALLEAVCGRKFWDYSGQRFSFRGRICLKNALLFGLMGVLAAWVLFPPLWTALIRLPPPVCLALCGALGLALLSDLSLSLRNPRAR